MRYPSFNLRLQQRQSALLHPTSTKKYLRPLRLTATKTQMTHRTYIFQDLSYQLCSFQFPTYAVIPFHIT